MATIREQQLLQTYNSFLKSKTISVGDLDQLMYQVDKVLMEIRRITESRDKYKDQLKELKKKLKGGIEDDTKNK